jgi:aspartate kinase
MDEQRIAVGGILHRAGLWLVGVMSAPDRPGLAAAIFRALGRERLSAQFIVQSIDLNNESHVQFCVAAEDGAHAVGSMQAIAAEVGARKVIAQQGVALVSVYGPDFRERPGIAGVAFGALAAAGINILAVSTSVSTVTCVIAEEDYDAALGAWRGVFALP